MASDPTLRAVHELLDAADVDLAGYRGAGIEQPMRLLAGKAALHGIEYAIGKLLELRATLLSELIGTYGVWDRPDVPPKSGD
jgi:hypothetical protein